MRCGAACRTIGAVTKEIKKKFSLTKRFFATGFDYGIIGKFSKRIWVGRRAFVAKGTAGDFKQFLQRLKGVGCWVSYWLTIRHTLKMLENHFSSFWATLFDFFSGKFFSIFQWSPSWENFAKVAQNGKKMIFRAWVPSAQPQGFHNCWGFWHCIPQKWMEPQFFIILNSFGRKNIFFDEKSLRGDQREN